MVHGAVKSGDTISGKLPGWYMIHAPLLGIVHMEKHTIAYITIKLTEVQRTIFPNQPSYIQIVLFPSLGHTYD